MPKNPMQVIAERLSQLYISYRGRFGVNTNGHLFVVKQDGEFVVLTMKHIIAHLHRRAAVCIFAGVETSKFMSLDVDMRETEVVDQILSAMEQAGIKKEYIHVSTSGNKGYHIELFFDGLVGTEQQKKLYRWILQETNLPKSKIEFRPTHSQSVKLPLSVNSKTGNMCWFLNKEDNYSPIEDLSYVMTIKPMKKEDFYVVIENLPEEQVPAEVVEALPLQPRLDIKDFDVNGLPQLEATGTRHQTMLSIAIYLRYKNIAYEDARIVMVDWYYKQDKHLSKSDKLEVLEDITKILTWVYSPDFYIPSGYVLAWNECIIQEKDAQTILSLSYKGERQILFYIMAWCRKFSFCRATVERIAHDTGYSVSGVKKILDSLLTKRLIYKKQGGVKVSESGFARESNQYILATNGLSAGKSEKNHCINLLELKDSFQSVYANTLLKLVSMEAIKAHMTKKEYQEFLKDTEGLTNG